MERVTPRRLGRPPGKWDGANFRVAYASLVAMAGRENIVADRTQSRSKRGAVPYVYASRRHSCLRKMALDMLFPGGEGFTADQLARFARGSERERALSIQLARAGERCKPTFELVGQQTRFEIKDRDGTILMVGKIEGEMLFHDERRFRAVYEIKSGQTFMNCETIEDLDHGRWTGHAVDQLLAYLLDRGREVGFFVIDRHGLPTIIPVILEDHLGRAETFMRDARIAIDAKDEVVEYTNGAYAIDHTRVDGTVNVDADWHELLPDHITRRATCLTCEHLNRHCTPPSVTMGEGVKLVTDTELIHAAERSCEIEETASEFKRLRKDLAVELRGVEHAILGKVELRGKWGKKTSVKFPDTEEGTASKAAIVKLTEPFKSTNPQGMWNPKYNRLPQPGETGDGEGGAS